MGKRVVPVQQFDYFSHNFRQFQKDYYHYAFIQIPLIYLQQQVLTRMVVYDAAHCFLLPAVKAKDCRDHYFIFRRRHVEETTPVMVYQYAHHFAKGIVPSLFQAPTVMANQKTSLAHERERSTNSKSHSSLNNE